MLFALRSVCRRPALSAGVSRFRAAQRGTASSPTPDGDSVLFGSDRWARTYVLNREKSLNALDGQLIDMIMAKLRLWEESDECKVIIAIGKGRAFCAGGDLTAVPKPDSDAAARLNVALYLKKEYELDYALAMLRKPYVAILDGITMGGGFDLAMAAPFRVATERAVFAMPETKIGYAPDVGTSYFLPRLDGYIGTYLALTGNSVKGRAAFQHGLATHFVPSVRIPDLLVRLATLDTQSPDVVDAAIEEFTADPSPQDRGSDLIGQKRAILDEVFSKKSVEEIVHALERVTREGGDTEAWATQVLGDLGMRGPTALKVALEAQKEGAVMSLAEGLRLELRFATAFTHGATDDFSTGVQAVQVDKVKTRPNWDPPTLSDIADSTIRSSFFSKDSPYTRAMPTMDFPVPPSGALKDPMRYALPSEYEITRVMNGMMVMNEDDVIESCERLRPGKKGVREKVKEVMKRQREVEKREEGDGILGDEKVGESYHTLEGYLQSA